MSELERLREHKVIGWCDYIDTADGRYVSEDEADALIAALEAELERVNRIVVSQSQQLGNTRSQREHELIEALDSTQADADTQFKLRAQAEAEVAKAWSERDHYLNAVMERNTELRKAEAERDRWEWVAREVVLSGYSRADIMQGLHEHDITDALARYDAKKVRDT